MASSRRESRKLPPEVEEYVTGYPPDVRAVVLRLRQLVLEVAPDAIEQLDFGAKMLAYGFAKTYKDMICVIMPLKAGVNFGFPRGAEMADPDGLLTGTGKRARHVRITNITEVAAPAIRRLLEEAVRMVGKCGAK